MRINCPHCGERGNEEFTYLGDASPIRPDDGGAAPTPEWEAYVYLRKNSADLHKELWFHASGCASWLVVTRNVRTHAITSVEAAHDVALRRVA